MFLLCKDFVYVVAPDVSSRREQPNCRQQQPQERDVTDTLPSQGTSWQRWHCPPVPTAAPSSAGIHKPIPSADPAVGKTIWLLLLKAAISQLLSHEEDSSREGLDGSQQWLELDVMGRTALYLLPKCRKSPTNNQLYMKWPKPDD